MTPLRLTNAYTVALANERPEYFELCNGRGVNLADGSPVAVLIKLLSAYRRTGGDPGRVRGPSLFNEVLSQGRSEGISHFFLGATESTLGKIVSRANEDLPGIRISGTFSPKFAPLDDHYLLECEAAVASTDADIIWVGLGTPKQDFVAAHLAQRTGKLCIGVGAAFDFFAVTDPEAHSVFQVLGIEWLFRLASEPRRLWKRYLIGNLKFLVAVARRPSTSHIT